MSYNKGSELKFESIPGGLAQAVFHLDGGDLTMLAVVSVLLSCISTAFIATNIAFDLDTNTGRRISNPEFYDYMNIPDTAAGCIAALMLLFLYHIAHALGKTFSIAVLAQTK
jgi:hypothetical protein